MGAQHVSLHVYLNNRLIGRLNKEPGGAIGFRYNDSWLNWSDDPARSQ